MRGAVYLFVKHRGGLVCWRPTQALSTATLFSTTIDEWPHWCIREEWGSERLKNMNKNYFARVVVSGLGIEAPAWTLAGAKKGSARLEGGFFFSRGSIAT